MLLFFAALVSRTFRDHCIVFIQTKKQAHRMHIVLGLLGINVGELHGNLSQAQVKTFLLYLNVRNVYKMLRFRLYACQMDLFIDKDSQLHVGQFLYGQTQYFKFFTILFIHILFSLFILRSWASNWSVVIIFVSFPHCHKHITSKHPTLSWLY